MCPVVTPGSQLLRLPQYTAMQAELKAAARPSKPLSLSETGIAGYSCTVVQHRPLSNPKAKKPLSLSVAADGSTNWSGNS